MDAANGQLSRAISVADHDVQGAEDTLARIRALSETVKAGNAAEAELVSLRHNVWRIGQYPAPPADRLLPLAAAPAGTFEIPETTPEELSAEVLRSAIDRNSCLLVRGLMSEQHADELIAGTNCALEAWRAFQAGEAKPSLASWFTPFIPAGQEDLNLSSRNWAAAMGTIFAADSPRNFNRLIDILSSMGILDLLTEYFGVRPVLSVPKTALKRVEPGTPGGWHQDILAYGSETRAINVWVALTSCGVKAPGLAVIPINPGGMVEDLPPPPVLTPISEETINRLAAQGAHVQEPVFEKGDVLLFDTVLPHQTQQGSAFTQVRYALECWFFSPTTLEDKWLPLHV